MKGIVTKQIFIRIISSYKIIIVLITCWLINGYNSQSFAQLANNYSSDSVRFVCFNKANKPILTPTLIYNNNTKSSLFLNKEDNFLSFEGTENNWGIKDDFSIQIWVKSTMKNEESSIILSTKKVVDYSLMSQKKSGWTLGISGGTFSWNIGSGNKRLSYRRENGQYMPLNDNKWHQLTMTYCSEKKEVRLYYDGFNSVIYNLDIKDGFDFTSKQPLRLGWKDENTSKQSEIIPEITNGSNLLQSLVDEFNRLNIGTLENDQFLQLVVNPKKLVESNIKKRLLASDLDSLAFSNQIDNINLGPLLEARTYLMKNAYTVFQVENYMKVAPLFKIYRLENNVVKLNYDVALSYSKKEKLTQLKMNIDKLQIWDRTITADEIVKNYEVNQKVQLPKTHQEQKSLTAAVWNIWHGGKHNTIEKDGWDSRKRIVEILKKENADVIMMQETYSSGDFIAAELGYYYATTADWDYLNQGSNISVMSRYPIEEIYVPNDASFMNVAVKIAISSTQKMYVMSNWYGMTKFSNVYDFHKDRFMESDSIPILFAGDFNAVPHTDGGKSPASKILLENGFTDAFRSMYPNSKKFPGYSHQSGYRIDQLYYKGIKLKNSSTKTISSYPTGFPSDHYLIISKFELKN